MVEIKSGDRFSRLVVIRKSDKKDKSRVSIYECKCDCGNTVFARRTFLLNGRVKSCGCFTKDRMTKHNKSNTRLYHIRNGMLGRCYNHNNHDYKNYGARGITVCEEWRNSFEKFYDWAIQNGYADNLTIDRENNNGNYEPSNCRWVSIKVQSRNTRKNCFYTYKGETKTLSEWAEITGIRRDTIAYRIKANVPADKIFENKLTTRRRTLK